VEQQHERESGGGRDAPTWRALENPESEVQDEKMPREHLHLIGHTALYAIFMRTPPNRIFYTITKQDSSLVHKINPKVVWVLRNVWGGWLVVWAGG